MLDEDRDADITALKDLLASRGWALLAAYAEDEWGPRGYGHKMNAAIAAAEKGPERAYQLADAAERVHHTADAVNELLKWPALRLSQLLGPTKKPGPLDHLRRITR